MPSINLDIILNAIDNATAPVNNLLGGLNKTQVVGGALTAVGAGITTAMTSALNSVSETGDAMLVASQKTGMAAEQLSALKYAGEQSGVSFEALQGSIIKLNKNMFEASQGSGPAAEAFKSLGVSVTDSVGKMKSQDVVFAELSDKLSSISDPAQRTALAMDIFGKSGANLMPLLSQGSKAIGEMTQRANELGLVWSGDDAANADNYGDAMADITYAFQGLTKTLVTDLFPILTPIILKVSDLVASISKFAKENPILTATIVSLVGAFGAVASVIGPVLLLLPQLSAWFTTATAIIGGIGPVLAGLGPLIAGIGAAITGPVGIVIGILAGIGLIVYQIIKHWDSIKAFFSNLWKSVSDIFSKNWKTILGIIFPAAGIVMLFAKHWEPITGFFSGLWDKVKSVFSSVWEWFGNAGKALWDTFTKGLTAAFTKPYETIKKLLRKIRNLLPFSDAKEGPLSSLTESGKKFVDTFMTGVEGQKSKLGGIMDGVSIGTPNIPQPAYAGATSGLNRMELVITLKGDGVTIADKSMIQNTAIKVIDELTKQAQYKRSF